MNELVEECRREWERLGVPDRVADEMAAELDADLAEAEAEGDAAEDVLGKGAFDPRSFAAAWAAERGVTQKAAGNGHQPRRRFRMIAAIGVFALLAAAGTGLVIAASPSGPTPLALAAPDGPQWTSAAGGIVQVTPSPSSRMIVTVDGRSLPVWSPDGNEIAFADSSGVVWVSRVDPLPLPGHATGTVAVDVDDSGLDSKFAGWVLLALGLAGIASSTLFWLWAGRPSRPRSSESRAVRP